MTDDAEIIRLLGRVEGIDAQLEALRIASRGSPRTFVAKTVTITTYPTTAATFYGIKRTRAYGTEVEGSAGSFSDDSYVATALNLGTAIPPAGTYLVVSDVGGGLFLFRYDG